ncbi:MAG: hypothetical protein K0R73_387 [Candidatus Midichloriaceae bacterium]|jgi:hypothetical protein|nr:hypothetical protein [Candidatus Midichloriaceae bacterium]
MRIKEKEFGMTDYLREICEKLKANDESLTKLDLSRVGILNEGAIALAEALEFNTTLTTLNLSGCGIHAEGAMVLSKSLKNNRSLTSLDLLHNMINTQGFVALTGLLKENQSIISFSVGGHLVENEATIASLSEALIVNQNITNLKLVFLRGRDSIIAPLTEALKKNKAIINFELICTKGVLGRNLINDVILDNNSNSNILFCKTKVCYVESANALKERNKDLFRLMKLLEEWGINKNTYITKSNLNNIERFKNAIFWLANNGIVVEYYNDIRFITSESAKPNIDIDLSKTLQQAFQDLYNYKYFFKSCSICKNMSGVLLILPEEALETVASYLNFRDIKKEFSKFSEM